MDRKAKIKRFRELQALDRKGYLDTGELNAEYCKLYEEVWCQDCQNEPSIEGYDICEDCSWSLKN